MGLDLTGARAALVAFLMPDAATIITTSTPTPNGRGGTIPGLATSVATVCSVNPVGGSEAVEAIVAVRGAYRIDFPVATLIREGATVMALGRRFRVVFAPPVGGLDLARTVGAEEIQ